MGILSSIGSGLGLVGSVLSVIPGANVVGIPLAAAGKLMSGIGGSGSSKGISGSSSGSSSTGSGLSNIINFPSMPAVGGKKSATSETLASLPAAQTAKAQDEATTGDKSSSLSDFGLGAYKKGMYTDQINPATNLLNTTAALGDTSSGDNSSSGSGSSGGLSGALSTLLSGDSLSSIKSLFTGAGTPTASSTGTGSATATDSASGGGS